MKSATLPLFPADATGTDLPFVDYDYPADRKNWSGIVLVGEAPGAEEARLKHPFVGRSGQLLGKALSAAGIDRGRCIVANVFRLQPPGNKIDHFFRSARAAAANGETLAEELGKFSGKYCCYPYAEEIGTLRAMLVEWKPKIVVALGRTPLWALTGLDGLLNLVGKQQPNRLYPAAPVMPTYHPSFILRGNWKLQDDWVAHLHGSAAIAI